jgi:hypothetical protein
MSSKLRLQLLYKLLLLPSRLGRLAWFMDRLRILSPPSANWRHMILITNPRHVAAVELLNCSTHQPNRALEKAAAFLYTQQPSCCGGEAETCPFLISSPGLPSVLASQNPAFRKPSLRRPSWDRSFSSAASRYESLQHLKTLRENFLRSFTNGRWVLLYHPGNLQSGSIFTAAARLKLDTS